MQAEHIVNTGNDAQVVTAAKVSFAADGAGITQAAQARLINYLATHDHWTPFAHVRITINTVAPLINNIAQSETLRTGLVVDDIQQRYRTSFVGWVKLLQAGAINAHYETSLTQVLLEHCPMAANAYKVTDYGLKQTTNDWPIRVIKQEHETNPEFQDVTIRMCAPVPIRTQCFKHKVGFVENEESRRYISGTPTLFTPDEWRAAPVGNKKQGSSDLPLSPESHSIVEDLYENATSVAIGAYEAMLLEGVAPEQARFVLPQGCEVNWYWTGNVAAFARFYNQRVDSHAQGEIQDLAKAVGEIIKPLFPVSWKLLTSK